MISVDANILIYAADSQSGDRHPQSVRLLRRAEGVPVILTLQTLGEFFNAITRKGRLDPRHAKLFVDDWMAAFPVRAADPSCLTVAVDFVADHHLAFWDAMLLATLGAAGCSLLLSEDMQDGRVLNGLTILNPFNPANAQAIDRYLPQ